MARPRAAGGDSENVLSAEAEVVLTESLAFFRPLADPTCVEGLFSLVQQTEHGMSESRSGRHCIGGRTRLLDPDRGARFVLRRFV